MSVFKKDFLERIKSRGASAKAQESDAQSRNVSLRKKVEQPDSVEELVRQARAAGRTGPLVVGPSRSSIKGSWREDARWLAEHYPQDFGEPKTGSICPNSQPARPSLSVTPFGETATVNPQAPVIVPESPQDSLGPPAPIPPLASAFWQGLLYGSPDALVPGPDATRALQLVCGELGRPLTDGEAIGTVRAGELRKLLQKRFGPIAALQAMAALWREAPPSPGAPEPAEDQSQLMPGLPDTPRWVQELNEPSVPEWMIENGLWCG